MKIFKLFLVGMILGVTVGGATHLMLEFNRDSKKMLKIDTAAPPSMINGSE